MLVDLNLEMGGNEMLEIGVDPYVHVHTVKMFEYEPNGKKDKLHF